MTLTLVVAVVVIALAFDYTNGFHDAANAIATAISTRALTPRIALLLAGGMNFIGALLGQEVAHTVSDTLSLSGTAPRRALVIILAALVGAIVWNLLTWWLGMPSSSSHALIGALVGAALAAGSGTVTVHWATVLHRVVVPMVVSPIIGFALAFALMLAIMWAFRRRNPRRTLRGFRALQTFSAAAVALGHGLQDAQKTMGVMFLAVGAAGYYNVHDKQLPLWIVLSAATVISLGTWSGGWRVMRTLGRRLIALDPARGFAAEAVGATVLYAAAFVFRAPISTTHTLSAAIAGAGATERMNAVRWGTVGNIVTAWVLTLPGAALVAALSYEILRFLA